MSAGRRVARWKASGALAAVLGAPLAMAQTLAAPFGECRAGYWSGTRNLDDREHLGKATCLVSWKQSVNDRVRVHIGGRLGVNDAGAARGARARLREAYVEADAGPWRLRLGRQIIAWGRADRINPTDHLSPRDYTALVPEEEEQRIGLDALTAAVRLGDSLELIGVVAPKFEAHRLPQGLLPRERVGATVPDDGEWAVKLEKSGGAWDGSLSFYDGYDRFVRYDAQRVSPSSVLFVGHHERLRSVGADLSTSLDGWGLRTEFASSRLSSACTGCPERTRSVQRLVLGIDRDVGDSANLNAQLFRIRRPDHAGAPAGPAQAIALHGALERLNSEFGVQEYGISLRIFGRYWNDRLKGEVSAIVDLSSHSSLVRPRASYAISDAVRLTAGLDWFRGDTQSFFGSRAANRLAYVEVAYVF